MIQLMDIHLIKQTMKKIILLSLNRMFDVL